MRILISKPYVIHHSIKWLLIKSISGKDANHETLESEKSYFISILIVPKDFNITVNMLHELFVYSDFPKSYKYLLQLSKNLNITTEYHLDLE